jgi:Uma2 family endonuclease
VQNPVRLTPYAEPQPDIALLRPREDFYTTAIPTAADVLLLVEVADSSLRYDRDVKLSMYAEAGILEVWLVDVVHRRMTAYREPSGHTYRQAVTLIRRGTLTPLSFPDLTLRWEDFFGGTATTR